MSEKRDSKLEKWAIPMFVIGLTTTTLNLAGVAEEFIAWRDFFREGVLEQYRDIRAVLTSWMPVDVELAATLFNYLMLFGLYAGWRSVCRYLIDGADDLPFALGRPAPGLTGFLDRLYAPLIFFLAPFMILIVALFDLVILKPKLTRADWQVLGLWFVPFIPFIGLIFFASDLISLW